MQHFFPLNYIFFQNVFAILYPETQTHLPTPISSTISLYLLFNQSFIYSFTACFTHTPSRHTAFLTLQLQASTCFLIMLVQKCQESAICPLTTDLSLFSPHHHPQSPPSSSAFTARYAQTLEPTDTLSPCSCFPSHSFTLFCVLLALKIQNSPKEEEEDMGEDLFFLIVLVWPFLISAHLPQFHSLCSCWWAAAP